MKSDFFFQVDSFETYFMIVFFLPEPSSPRMSYIWSKCTHSAKNYAWCQYYGYFASDIQYLLCLYYLSLSENLLPAIRLTWIVLFRAVSRKYILFLPNVCFIWYLSYSYFVFPLSLSEGVKLVSCTRDSQLVNLSTQKVLATDTEASEPSHALDTDRAGQRSLFLLNSYCKFYYTRNCDILSS